MDRHDRQSQDDVTELLRQEERGSAGQRLAAARSDIEPRPEFEKQLLARLTAREGVPNVAPRPAPLQRGTLEVMPGRKEQTAPGTPRGVGRATSITIGLMGAAAMVLLLVGMVLLAQRQRDTRPVAGLTPGPGTPAPADSIDLVRALDPVRTLPMQRAVRMAWSPDGRVLATLEWPRALGSDISRPLWYDDKAELKLWDVQTGALLSSIGHGYISDMQWSPDGSMLALGLPARTIYIVDRNGALLRTMAEPPIPTAVSDENQLRETAISNLNWSPDGRFLASAATEPYTFVPYTNDGVVHIWDPLKGTLDRSIRVPAPPGLPDPANNSSLSPAWTVLCAWSPDGSKIAVSLMNTPAQVLDAESGRQLYVLDKWPDYIYEGWPKARTHYPIWSPDGRLLSAVTGPFTHVYDAATGDRKYLLPADEPAPPVPTAPGPLGATPEPTADPSQWWYVEARAWSPDGSLLATAGSTYLRVWDMDTGLTVGAEGYFHIEGTNSLQWSPSGSMLALLEGGTDEDRINTGVVTILDSQTWDVVRTLPSDGQRYSTYNAFLWSPDGRMVAVSSKEGIVLWGEGEAASPLPTAPEGTPTPFPSPNPTDAPGGNNTPNSGTPVSDPAAGTLTAVAIPSGTSAPGTAMPETCGSWEIAPSPNVSVVNELLAVDALAPDDVWAVGYHSTDAPESWRTLAMHWDGKEWRAVATPNLEGHNRLTDVAMVAKNDVWAVGYYGGPDFDDQSTEPSLPLVLHWDGTEWTVSPGVEKIGPDVSTRLTAVEAISANDVWAMGHYGGGNPPVSPDQPIWRTLIIHWDGKEWRQIESPDPGAYLNQLFDVSASAPDDVWAAGMVVAEFAGGDYTREPLALHYDGREWKNVPVPEGATYITGVVAISKSDAWMVANLDSGGSSEGKSLHWDGNTWSYIHIDALNLPDEGTPPPVEMVEGVAAASSGEVWAVGSYSVPAETPDGAYTIATLALRWDGSRWDREPSPNIPVPQTPGVTESIEVNNLNDVAALPNGEAWAVGSTRGGTSAASSLVLRYRVYPCAAP